MKALRLVIHQNSANYRKEESTENKMTYPLPPLSTVIGAIHAACGFTSYKPMDISIQGCYESMHKEPYTDYCFLNNIMDDRGILVKMRNGELLSNAFDKVASAKKSQGNSFKDRVTIQIHNEELLKEYQGIRVMGDKIKEFKDKRLNKFMTLIKQRKKTLTSKKKFVDKNSRKYAVISNREQEIKEFENEISQRMKDFEQKNYIKPLSKFRSLTKSLKYYEILNNIKLIIHIHTEDECILNQILSKINNLKCIGRSEDFVDIQDICIVELQELKNRKEIVSPYSAYLDMGLVNQKYIFTKIKNTRNVIGTKYLMNKNYTIVDGKRIFRKKRVIYASQYTIEETTDNLLVDYLNQEEIIVNFL